MSNGLVKKVAGKETIEHLKKDLQFYSTRDLSPNQVYLLISKTEEYMGIDEGVLLVTIEQTLGEDYVSKINGKFEPNQEDYSQQPESKPYEPTPTLDPNNISYEQEHIQNIPESIKKPKKKMSKAGKIIGLIAFLTLASVGGYVGSKFYKDYRRNKKIEAVRKKHSEEQKKNKIDDYSNSNVSAMMKGKILENLEDVPETDQWDHIQYIGPDNSNTCKVIVSFEGYESSNLEAKISGGSKGKFILKNSLKSITQEKFVEEEDHHITFSGYFPGDSGYVLKSEENTQKQFYPTRLVFSLTNPIIIKDNKKTAFSNTPLYVADLNSSFKGNIKISGDFDKDYLDSLNSRLKTIILSDEKGKFSFDIKNRQFNAKIREGNFKLTDLVFQEDETLKISEKYYRIHLGENGANISINLENGTKSSLDLIALANFSEYGIYQNLDLKYSSFLLNLKNKEIIINSEGDIEQKILAGQNMMKETYGKVNREMTRFKNLSPGNYIGYFSARAIQRQTREIQEGESQRYLMILPNHHNELKIARPNFKRIDSNEERFMGLTDQIREKMVKKNLTEIYSKFLFDENLTEKFNIDGRPGEFDVVLNTGLGNPFFVSLNYNGKSKRKGYQYSLIQRNYYYLDESGNIYGKCSPMIQDTIDVGGVSLIYHIKKDHSGTDLDKSGTFRLYRRENKPVKVQFVNGIKIE